MNRRLRELRDLPVFLYTRTREKSPVSDVTRVTRLVRAISAFATKANHHLGGQPNMPNHVTIADDLSAAEGTRPARTPGLPAALEEDEGDSRMVCFR